MAKKNNGNANDALSAWLEKNPVVDKDAALKDVSSELAPAEQRRVMAERRSRLLAKKYDSKIDLHGKTKEEAWLALDAFIDENKNNGAEKVLIVHGKGNHSPGEAVLGDVCREFLEQCPNTGETGTASAADGGSGATWAIIK